MEVSEVLCREMLAKKLNAKVVGVYMVLAVLAVFVLSLGTFGKVVGGRGMVGGGEWMDDKPVEKMKERNVIGGFEIDDVKRLTTRGELQNDSYTALG